MTPLPATGPSALTLVMDPHDDAAHTHTALAAHHPPSGRITLHPGPGTTSDTGEEVVLREARAWLHQQGIRSIDLLKLDAEGCEPAILESLRDHIPSIRVIYAESDDGAARRRIDQLVASTHEAVRGEVVLGQGMFCYVERELLRENPTIADAVTREVGENVNRHRAPAPGD